MVEGAIKTIESNVSKTLQAGSKTDDLSGKVSPKNWGATKIKGKNQFTAHLKIQCPIRALGGSNRVPRLKWKFGQRGTRVLLRQRNAEGRRQYPHKESHGKGGAEENKIWPKEEKLKRAC